MGDFTVTPNDSIFENREALLEEWTPDSLVGRDKELGRYHAALQPVINNQTSFERLSLWQKRSREDRSHALSSPHA